MRLPNSIMAEPQDMNMSYYVTRFYNIYSRIYDIIISGKQSETFKVVKEHSLSKYLTISDETYPLCDI